MRDLHPGMLEARIFELEQNGGGGGTTDYENLENKPKIENVELVGNLTFEKLGIASAEDLGQTNEDLLDVQQTANQNHADIATINSKLGVVPDDENIEEQINDIKDNLVKNDLGEPRSLVSYSISNPYTFESDGYVRLEANGGKCGFVLYGRTKGSLVSSVYSSTGSVTDTIFVKKGMKGCPHECIGTFNLYFWSLE